ncbi:ABC transporter transmembrane domain-containing protein [Pseudosulfitobacter sp. DSM 107133]|uniref:ABC transporter transmembrane domain-containing protein n=1 Tax=Pseudosulfitobacter sp. DSM 107133 TaxID=2883100 RepID=UPI000DF27266|nr:ABC transporter transmembrane domain-containing protein [Pseudosulfitobacter sp. DSM 107133]UOA28757.1 putative ABC transporter ATP-binding protein [Pseudosulfitobacter sp. DSM 107133]
MERTLFSFIWKYSKREQVLLLLVTLVTFPFLYATLELPKRIINDAIGADSDVITYLGVDMPQVVFLLVLCGIYLVAVLVHGLLKMRLNTMKGIVSERMLRRLRYTLIARMMRFPRSYFRTTSQGELVSMVTSEAEPMGGLMGDALAQPVFQAGQMLIIVVFLFAQSIWFGLAGIALIPLQAWLIPMLQRQINVLNKARIVEVRALSSEIGESAAGVTDLRTNGGWRYRLAQFTDRLGRLFDIRYRIYQKKFFMKFLNNFITQLTPFFFYSVGGYLAINGQISVGALVAALAAYKDLSSPWKELLTYYNQVQDMSVRWDVVMERFAPKGMVAADKFEGAPKVIPHLDGSIVLDNVTVRDSDGNAILENINLTIPAAARVAIQVTNQNERTALAELLTREMMPTRGHVTMSGHDMAELHQAVIAARIGYAHSRPYLFDGTLGSNLLMPLMTSPRTVLWDPGQKDVAGIEAARAGNSTDSLVADWVDPELAGLTDPDEIRAWWFKLIKAIGIEDQVVRRMMGSNIDVAQHPALAEAIVALRPEVERRLTASGLDEAVNRFSPDRFNPSMPLGGNLLFAAPRVSISQQALVEEGRFLHLVIEQGLAEQGIAISQTLIETLLQTFGRDGTNHPLFTALGIEEEMYERLADIAERRREHGDVALSEDEFALLLTVPFALTAEQFGAAFPESFKDEILKIRRENGPSLRALMSDMFVPIAPENYFPRLTILENALYGRVSAFAGARFKDIEILVSEVLEENGLQGLVAETIFDIPTGLGGIKIPTVLQERVAFSRAAIKRPDILVLDRALASHNSVQRSAARSGLRDLLPASTLIFMEESFENPDAYDLFVEIRNGRIDGILAHDADDESGAGADDLRHKLQVIARTEMFGQLDSRNQRLLAFAAQWYPAKVGQRVFSMDEAADAAYLCVSGQALLSYRDADGQSHPITTVHPGRVIGDLSIILNEPRQSDLTATTDCNFLRLGAEEFRAVYENDTGVLLQLLRTVGSHLTGAADLLRDARLDVPVPLGPVAPSLEDDA